MEVLSTSTNQTKNLAGKLAKKLNPSGVIALYGDLGSGKTTLTRFVVEALKIPAKVQSPTFIIARKYKGGTGVINTVNHIDLYRLTTKEAAKDLGLEEIFNEASAITVIEWPKLIEDLLPKRTIKIFLEYVDKTTRKMTLTRFWGT
jgi:tRNA threonylcarbamoyladenosine biosynthesis protein TsaE